MPRRAKKLPSVLRPRELGVILEHAQDEAERMMLRLMGEQGLRVSEVCKLRVEDIDLDARTLLVVEGKGSKDRLLPIAKLLYGELAAFIGSRLSGPLFPSPRGGHYTTRALRYRVDALKHRARFGKRLTPHTFRHSFATDLVERGANLEAVRQLMGHESIATTQIYLHLSTTATREAIDLPRRDELPRAA